jgi:hypothetical protein
MTNIMNWITKSGESIPISKMGETHLINTLKMVMRNQPELAGILGYWSMPPDVGAMREMLIAYCKFTADEQAINLHNKGFKMNGDIAQNQVDEGMDQLLSPDEDDYYMF